MTDGQREALEALFRYCVQLPAEVPVAGVSRQGWSAWDSMAHVALVGAIEDQFDVRLTIDDALAMEDWDRCVRVVAGQL